MAYDYVKLGVIQKNNKKEVVFSDMGFIHQDDTRDAYDGNGTSSDNFIFTAKNGNHIFTLTAYENGSNIGSIQFTVPSGILTQATTIDDVCYIMAQNTSYDSFGVFLVMYIVYSIETYTENNTKYLKLYCENMFTGRDTTIDVNVSDYT
ncbi:MAG: hypothetical protein J6W64_04100 [Bacilli bacterium]|nr:hypothetical protein [Bacilli bacterium]